MRAPLLALLVCCAGCGTEIDPAEVGAIDGYQEWPHFTKTTDVPGHPDSVRVIYKNDVAAAYPHAGRYPLGTIIVKEIFNRNGDRTKGSLRYIGVARKLGDGTGQPTDDGWLFTYVKDGKETQLDLCWKQCHQAGPFDGLWFDYGREIASDE
jgi:hypothetical protein